MLTFDELVDADRIVSAAALPIPLALIRPGLRVMAWIKANDAYVTYEVVGVDVPSNAVRFRHRPDLAVGLDPDDAL